MANLSKNRISLFSLCSVFVFLWGLYGFHWYDADTGTFVDSLSNICLAINLTICFYCVFFTKIKYPFVLQYLLFFLFVYSIYEVFYLVGGVTYYFEGKPVGKLSYIIGFYRSFLSLFPFYYFTLRGDLNDRSIIVYFLVLFGFYLVYDYFVSVRMLSIDGFESGFTNNLGYVFVSLFPIVFLLKRPIVKYLMVLIIVGLTFVAMKRGPIIIAVILVLWFFRNEMSFSKGKKKFLTVFLIITLLVVAGWLMSEYWFTNSFFQSRLEHTLEGDSSGRDVLYKTIVSYYFNNENFIQQLFGLGPDATYGIVGMQAHNDWLEILVSQGIFGLILYLVYWLAFFRYWRRIPKTMNEYYIIGTFLITQFIRSLISMSYSAIPTAAIMILGYSMANIEINKKTVE